VTQALGLPASLELTAMDPAAAAKDGLSTGQVAFVADAVVSATVALAAGAGAQGDVYARLAAAIVAAPGPGFDPTTPAVMKSLGLSAAVAADASAIASAGRLLLLSDLNTDAANGAQLLTDVAGASRALQGDAATALQGAAASGATSSVVGTYTGANLATIAAADVQRNAGSPPHISYTDVSTDTVGFDTSTAYSGPVDYLQHQYLWPDSDSVAIQSAVPNTFLKGGPGADALAVSAGKNVLDGSSGSNFLTGGHGADGGFDTFFVDARGDSVTWSTIVNFHQGDQATIFGFFPGTSTEDFRASDGVTGYTGFTLHSETEGPGTGVKASMTFAGIDQATAQAHFVYTTGTLPGSIGYLLIQYD